MRRPVLLVPLLLLLPACDIYTSAVPLDQPGQAPFDEALLGTWAVAGEPDGDSAVVLRAGDHEYLVQVSDIDGKTQTALAHVTVLHGVHFLNVYDHSDSTYSFLRFVVAKDTLRFSYMLDGVVTPNSKTPIEVAGIASPSAPTPPLRQHRDSHSLRTAVLQHLDDPGLFDDEETALTLRHRPRETFCVDYDVLTATNSSTGKMMIFDTRGEEWRLFSTLDPGTHHLKVPFVRNGWAFGVTPGSRPAGGDGSVARLDRACH